MQAIEQFRARYPQGGLIGEFVILENGKGYLVKVTVRAEEAILATGLAVAETVEVAEDRARDRALAALGITSASLPSALPPLSSPTATGAMPYGDTAPFPDLDLPAPLPTAANPESGGTSAATAAAWERDDFSAAPVEPPVEPPAVPKAAKSQSRKKPRAEAAAVPEPVPAGNPLGTAEVVTRAKAELKRLGWTREQGQKFLLERYGKRETRQLDDREWRDLYDYLYEQPSPARSDGAP